MEPEPAESPRRNCHTDGTIMINRGVVTNESTSIYHAALDLSGSIGSRLGLFRQRRNYVNSSGASHR